MAQAKSLCNLELGLLKEHRTTMRQDDIIARQTVAARNARRNAFKNALGVLGTTGHSKALRVASTRNLRTNHGNLLEGPHRTHCGFEGGCRYASVVTVAALERVFRHYYDAFLTLSFGLLRANRFFAVARSGASTRSASGGSGGIVLSLIRSTYLHT